MLGAVGVSRSEARAFDGAEIALLEALGRQGGQALERARLYDRLHRLQTTTAALARALTPQEVAATAAAQSAEALGASSAWVALLDEGTRTLELAHAAGHETATRQRFASFSLDAELPLAHAARTVTPLWLESPDEIFGPYPRFAEVRPQAQAAALLPLSDDGVALGAIGLVFDHAHVFRPPDRDYLLALTRLCGQALGRARRYQAEHDLAATLQQALLPESLPDADGLALAVRYLPATDGAFAGGDFYEAVQLGGGRLGIAVGDVVGHGPEAAAAMGQLRSALRAYALEGRAPGARAAAALALRRRRGRCARRDARLRDRGPGRAPAALRLGRASAAAAGDLRGRAALPGGGARGAAGPLARLRLRGRRRRLAGVRDADPVLRRGDRAPRGAARRGNGAARGRRGGGRAPGAGRALQRTARDADRRVAPATGRRRAARRPRAAAARRAAAPVVRRACRSARRGAGGDADVARGRRGGDGRRRTRGAGRRRAVRELGRARLPARHGRRGRGRAGA